MSKMKKQNSGRSDYSRKLSRHLRRTQSLPGAKSTSSGRRHLRVIIELTCKPSRQTVRRLCRHIDAGKGKLIRVKRRMTHMRFVAARVSASCLKRLCKIKFVRRVHPDRKVRVSLRIATPSIGSAKLQKRGLTGKGVTIAVIDTGVYPHPDLTKPRNRIIVFRDFVRGRNKPYDDNGHGTHVAGDAAGNGYSSKGRYKGPASNANLAVLKAFDKTGSADSSDVIAAIEWVIRNRKKYGIRIVNMSFGIPGVKVCSEDPICIAAEKAWRNGIFITAAAGNSGPDANSIDSPGISPLLMTVGAADDRRTVRQSDDRVAEFSARGSSRARKNRIKPDLVAPGVDIVSLRAPGSMLDRNEPESRVGSKYFRMTGTSMAAPLIAGAAAQLLQNRKSLTPRQLKSLLMRHAVSLGFKRSAQGKGEANVRFAANRIRCRRSRPNQKVGN